MTRQGDAFRLRREAKKAQRSALVVAGPYVPPPSRPLEVAREFVRHAYVNGDGHLVLRDHRGDFFHWNGSSWPEVDRRDVRAGGYRFLDNAHYYDADGIPQ